MNVKRILKQLLKGLILTCWIAGVALAVCVAVFHWNNPVNQSQLKLLAQSIEGSNERFATLNLSLDSLSSQLDSLESTVNRHQSAIVAIQSEQSVHKTQLASLQSLSETNKQRLNTFQSMFDGQDKELKRLIQRAYRESKAVITNAKAPRNKTPHLSKSKQSKAQRSITPPFQLFDIQQRGVVLLAAVAPHNATSLGQVALKRRGERFSGWKILDVTPANILVQKGNQQVTIRITP